MRLVHCKPHSRPEWSSARKSSLPQRQVHPAVENCYVRSVAGCSLVPTTTFAGDPYEEWAVVRREHLRLCYLDALDQLSLLRLNTGDYTGCIDVCLKLLACDNCREDAHCRLMRCYSREGQLQLALRQYNSCAAALRRELGVAPDPATTELFDHIRRREAI